MDDHLKGELRRCLKTWLALLLLLALTAGSAWVHLGGWNSALNLLIGALKAGLVAVIYMELAQRDGVIRIAACAGLVMLFILLGLSGADYATRVLWRAPWQSPPLRPSLSLLAPGHGQHLGQMQRHAPGGLDDLLAAAVAVGDQHGGGRCGAHGRQQDALGASH